MTVPSVFVPAFLPFHLTVVPQERVAGRLRAAVSAVAGPEQVQPLLDAVWQDLATTVEGHSFRMLIREFHGSRDRSGLPRTPGGDRALREFSRRLEDPDQSRQILDRYPVLRRRLATIVDNSLDAYADLFGACARDRTVLCAAGLLATADDQVTGLSGTSGDLHNDHRKVVGIEFAGGGRLVYKPRALVSDQFVRDLLAAAGEHLEHSLAGCVPASVTIGSHGWQRYIPARAMTEPDQPRRYFYRFGALCALFGAIGASDLHEENLLAAGENPCVVDTETTLRPDAGVDNDSLAHLLINQLKLSVGATMLVPMLDPRSRNDLMMAGVGVERLQSSAMTKPVIADKETDDIAVRWENVVYRHRDNVPRLGAAALSPVQHFDDIRTGYLHALRAVRHHGVVRVLDDYADMPVRCVLRSTMVYSRFLDAATHPDYLTRDDESERLLGLLGNYPDYLGPEAAGYVGEQERSSLRTGNVPYFTARGGSTELATPTTRLPAVHRTSPLDVARTGLALNGRARDLYHHFLLEESFGEIAADDPAGLSVHSVFAEVTREARAGEWWPGIAGTIAEVGVSYDGPGGAETGWVCGIGPDRHAATLTPGNFVSFHDNGGIVAFLANAADREPGFRDASAAADRGLVSLLTEYAATLDQAPEGVFTGGASRLLLPPSRMDGAALDRILGWIDERAAAGVLETDLANGPAGVLMILLSRFEAGLGPPVSPPRLARLHDLVRGHLRLPRTAPWYDVAHGELGLRWAASRGGRVLGDADAPAASADWLSARLAEDDQPPGPGWCQGSAGLLVAAAEIFAAAGRPDRLPGGRLAALADAATRLPAGGPVDLSVCHGSSGVVQSLIAASRILEDPFLLDRAGDYQRRVLAASRANGFCTGCPGRTSLLGYMLGWSGVGDTDLILHAARTGAGALAVPVGFFVGAGIPAGRGQDRRAG